MMRLLTQEFFAQSPVLLFPLVALCLFMGVFTVVALRTFLTRKEAFDPMANLPLEDLPHGTRPDPQLPTHSGRGANHD